MQRFGARAALLCLFLGSACGDDGDVVGSDGPTKDGGRSTSADGGKKDGGPKGGGGGSDGGIKGGGGGGPNVDLTPTATPFTKDATDGAGLAQGDLDKLRAGGPNCKTNILYPYDQTVFPAGLVPPTIMWNGESDGALIHFAYEGLDTLDYQTAVGGNGGSGELHIDADDWNQIVRRTQPQSSLVVTFNVKHGGDISTCRSKWKIAPGAMVGSIFYNTYDSPESNGEGAIIRLTLGEAQSEVYLKYEGRTTPNGPCISCHSVSADGQTLAASTHNYSPGAWSYEAASYAVTPDVQPKALTDLPDSTFGGFTPDGKFMLAIGQPDCTNGSNSFPRSPNNFPLVKGPAKATLIDAKSGQSAGAQGLDANWFMWMPQFSPKGDKVVFNHAKIGADGRTDRRELAVMKFDEDSKTFSELKVIVSNQGPAPTLDYAPMPILGIDVPNAGNNCNTNTPSDVGAIPGGTCSGPCYPAWPFFTPDGQGVVYSLVSEPDFMSAFPGRDTPSKSELWYVDIATMQSVRLDVANKGNSDADELTNYYPTVLPVQVGGYFWLFWTSTRDWGNRQFASSGVGGIVGGIFGNMSTTNATKKRIWVSAIKPRAITEAGQEDISDTSSPGFYLEGQSDTGNVRAFATLNPCMQNGSDCTSGLDCCSGYCDIGKGADKGSCVEQKECSDVNETCKTDADCCPPEPGQPPNLCIGEYCGFLAL